MDYSQNLGYWIKHYSRLANQAMDAALKPYGIGRTQWYVLYHINAEQSLSQRKLQDLLQVESATLTSLIRSLTRKGLVKQQADPHDGRGKTLLMTAAGRALWRTLPDPIVAVKAIALSGIAPADIDHARAVIKQAVHNLEKGEKS